MKPSRVLASRLVWFLASAATAGAADAEMPPDLAPATMGFLAEDGDDYIVTEGEMKGQRGYFSRDANGAVAGIDLAGRVFTRKG